jgi:hypothetical protein
MTETKHANIAAALCAAQKAMGKALKQSNNPHFRSKYADLGNVMDACLPALNDNGIAVYQPAGRDDNGEYIATVLIHESGETLECRVPLIVNKNDMQGYGSATTYARRYGLMSMAGIAPEDDDGNAAAAAPPAPRQQKAARTIPDQAESEAVKYLNGAESLQDLQERWGKLPAHTKTMPDVVQAKDARKAALQSPITDDQIPY